jgi:hypothetical protein
MAFDQNDTRPIVKPSRKTTKVNISMAAAVVVFFVLGGMAIAMMRHFHG